MPISQLVYYTCDRCYMVFSFNRESIREFSEQELVEATDSFSSIIGKGSCGKVFKGTLHHTAIAVKLIEPVSYTKVGSSRLVCPY